MEDKIALIAGDGNLPVVIASRLTDMGTPPVVYSVREKVGDISKFALEVVNIIKPDIGYAIKDMKSRGVKIIMAGLVSKTGIQTLTFRSYHAEISCEPCLQGRPLAAGALVIF